MIRRELPQSRRVDHPMIQMPEAGSVEGSPFEARTLGQSVRCHSDDSVFLLLMLFGSFYFALAEH